MRVQVGIGEGEERELVDGVRDDARRVPEPPIVGEVQLRAASQHRDQPADGGQQLRQRALACAAGCALRELVNQQLEVAEVADDRHKEDPGQPGQQGADAQPLIRPLLARELSGPVAVGQVEGHRERADAGQCEEGGHRQVVRHPRHDAGQLDQRADDDEAEVIVVHEPARVPRVVGREGGRADHRVEVGEVHRFLAAPGRVPQVGVADTDQQEQAEEDQEDRFFGQQQGAAFAHEGEDGAPAPPADGR